MRTILTIVALLFIGDLSAQSILQRSLDNHRHGVVLSSNATLGGSEILFRPGLSIGYSYFGDKYNLKSLVGYSRWSKNITDGSVNEFRFNFRYEYERYVNNWFSLAAFVTPDFRYNDEFYPNNDPRNFSEVTYALGLGLSPRIYRLTDKYYFSLGLDLPIVETGYFQGDGPDPDISEMDTFRQGLDTKLFSREVRAVATFGYRF